MEINILLKKIEMTLNEKKDQGQDLIAAFDADGTLWDTDTGELFLQFLVQKNILPPTEGLSAWDFYIKKRWGGAADYALDYLTSRVAGLSPAQVKGLAEECFTSQTRFPFFETMKKLVTFLLERDVKVYVVSASPKWAVEEPANQLGIHRDLVIGLTLSLGSGGLYTEEVTQPRSVGESKILALLNKTVAKKPFLAAGNTLSDLSLLSNASDYSIAIQGVDKTHPVFPGEQALFEISNKNSWINLDLKN